MIWGCRPEVVDVLQQLHVTDGDIQSLQLLYDLFEALGSVIASIGLSDYSKASINILMPLPEVMNSLQGRRCLVLGGFTGLAKRRVCLLKLEVVRKDGRPILRSANLLPQQDLLLSNIE